MQLEGTENRITVARNRYIQTVQEYNVLARSFPTNLTAMVFHYEPKATFTVQNEAQISTPPQVDFRQEVSAATVDDGASIRHALAALLAGRGLRCWRLRPGRRACCRCRR